MPASQPWTRLHRAAWAAWLVAALLAGACVRSPSDDARHITYACWGSVQQERAEQALVDAFESANPDIKVDLLVLPHRRYQDKIQAMMIADAAPDVMMVSLLHAREWAARGVLVDLTAQMDALAAEDEVLPVPARAARWYGRVHALPVNSHGPVTYVNLDAFRAAGLEPPPEDRPLTWQEVLDIAPRLSRRHGDASAPTDYAMLAPTLVNFLWDHGVMLFDDLEHPTRVSVDVPAAVQALDLWRKFSELGYAAPLDPGAESEGLSTFFRDGRVAMYFQGRWVTPDFAGHTAFKWAVRPFPRGPANAGGQHGFTGIAVWAGSPRREAAVRFATFYASPEGARVAMRYQRTVPIYRDLAYGPGGPGDVPPGSMKVFAATMEQGRGAAYLYAPGTGEVARIVDQRTQQAIAQPELSSAVIIRGLAADLQRWLDRKRATGLLDPPLRTEASTISPLASAHDP